MANRQCWVSAIIERNFRFENINFLHRQLGYCIGLAPDVVIYDYLVKVNLLTPALKTKLLNYMKQGYQNELGYKHDDNSFSAFGNSDPSGSSWLTAFVLRIFIQASPYITIDNNVIINGLAWLAGQQVH